MSFLGPVTSLGGQLVRPHDIDIFTTDEPGSIPATVTRLQRIGFEVRAELDAGASQPWVQLTRGQAEGLGLAVGDQAWLRPSHDASTLATAADSSGR
jgi:sulfate transport system ATP-binding protein